MCGERLWEEIHALRADGSSPRVRGTRRSGESRQRRGRFIPACAGNARPPSRRRPARPVHPRVCGERPEYEVAPERVAGSSPRVRGTLLVARVLARHQRFIPACAGNALAALPVAVATTGSSPRVRGTQDAQVVRVQLLRFIPACAGNAAAPPSCISASPVHPRVCGERGQFMSITAVDVGSSPRVRGTRQPYPPRLLGDRFIPACAGNAGAHLGRRVRLPVHPRVCGERRRGNLRASLHSGSSPRVRGTRRGRPGPRLGRRFIPACAGNATAGQRRRCSAPVHPRVCGERWWHRSVDGWWFGSSPRVRGTRARRYARLRGRRFIPRVRGTRPKRRPDQRGRRFIPACAGNATRRCGWCSTGSVHPRVCGERHRTARPMFSTAGSSPRVRGTRASRAGARGRGRFIPACAGNASAAGCGASSSSGSSPRVRGTHLNGLVRTGVPRFIPACAGNATRSRPAWIWSTGSSPRVRGTRSTSRAPGGWRRFIPACAGNAEH